jgi:hypothetical protein
MAISRQAGLELSVFAIPRTQIRSLAQRQTFPDRSFAQVRAN